MTNKLTRTEKKALALQLEQDMARIFAEMDWQAKQRKEGAR